MTAQPQYPMKPIRFIIPFAPGGSTDFTARTLAQKLSESWHQQVIVDNRAGAAGVIGVQLAAKSAPDGYTILFASSSIIATRGTRAMRRSQESCFSQSALIPASFASFAYIATCALTYSVNASGVGLATSSIP
jgi:tripartite-type tricarboxylate transporter receptor subunit TctC